MIKFKAAGKNGTILLGFGMTDENIERLKQGRPIYFQLDELGIEGYDVMIMHGKDEADIKNQLQKAGMKPGGE